MITRAKFLVGALACGAMALETKVFGADASQRSEEVPNDGYAIFAAGASSFALKILGYQYPEITDDEYDSNWLMIGARVSLEGKSWSFIDPCLMTSEVEGLAAWLAAISQNLPAKDYCGFTEPNLEFERKADKIRIRFAMESRPPWAIKNDFDTEYSFDVPIDTGLLAVVHDLRRQLALFPERGPG